MVVTGRHTLWVLELKGYIVTWWGVDLKWIPDWFRRNIPIADRRLDEHEANISNIDG